MNPDQFAPLDAPPEIPPNLSQNPSLRLQRHLVLAQWPHPDSLEPYSMQAALDWHCIAEAARWNTAKMIADFRPFLRHSRRVGPSWRQLIFVFREDLLLTLSASMGGERELVVWARDRDEAESQLKRFRSIYLLPERELVEVDHFFVLTVSAGEVEARRVTVPPFRLSETELQLHYGNEFCDWNRSLLAKLSESKIGLTILQGPPGTGKTSYLKHLVHQLRSSHRCYYLPVTVYPMLAAPATVDFWLSQNEFYPNQRRIVIIEDAETLLMQRAADNHDSLSNLLNISDGFLGSFLNLQILCTTNRPIEKIDPAIVRPGRLQAHYTFRRLSMDEAQRLAAAKGLTISVRKDYSLAEIYNQDEVSPDVPRPVGFFAHGN